MLSLTLLPFVLSSLVFYKGIDAWRNHNAMGQAFYRYPTVPAAGLSVICYEEDRFYPDQLLGYGVTGKDGRFRVHLDSSKGDWWGKMDVYCELSGFDLVVKIRTPTLEPNNYNLVNFGHVSVYRNRIFKGCNSNGCGPVVNGHNLDWLVPDLDFSEACLSHDCCLMQCYAGPGSPDAITCNKEFDEVLLADCMLSDIPFCRQLAAIYSHAVNNFDIMKHWCDLQKRHCGIRPPMCG